MSEIVTQKSGSLDVRCKSDEQVCDITGMAVTSNGTLLLADYANSNIKSVTPGNDRSVVSLPAKPGYITVLNSTTAVAAAYSNKLYLINISDIADMKLREVVELEYEVWAITNYRDNLIVTCLADPPCTKMINLNGKELWTLSKDKSGRKLFSKPEGVTTTDINNTATIIVTDWVENTITLLESETGSYIRTIDPKGKEPLYITADKDGNVYICYRQPKRIYAWSNDFQKYTFEELQRGPRAVIYGDDKLYISYNSNNEIDFFDCIKSCDVTAKKKV